MKVTREEVSKIKPGSSLTVWLSNYNECDSARATAYRTALAIPRPDVERYKVEIDTKTFKVTVTPVNGIIHAVCTHRFHRDISYVSTR